MKDCWKILGISKTSDRLAIRKAYRDRIKRWHPDTVRSPEMIRHYTIKCAEINDAYRQALDYCSSEIDAFPSLEDWFRQNPLPHDAMASRPQQTPSETTHDRSVWATVRHFVSVLMTFAVVLAMITAMLNAWAIESKVTSFPLDSLERMVLSGLAAIILTATLG